MSVVFGVPFSPGSLERLVDAMRDTIEEFGGLAADHSHLLAGGPALSESDRCAMQLRRFRQQAERAARETAYYASVFERIGVNPATLRSFDAIGRVPRTSKAALRDNPHDFVARTA